MPLKVTFPTQLTVICGGNPKLSTMKKQALFVLVLVCAIFACKKSNSGSGYHVTASIGGKGKAFNFTEPIGVIEKTGQAITSLYITGILDTIKGESIQIQLSCYTDKGIVPGTYTDTAADYIMQAIYSADEDHTFYAGTMVASYSESAGTPVKNHLKIVITAIDDKSARGTFSGDLLPDGSPGTTPVAMTNGDFYANVE